MVYTKNYTIFKSKMIADSSFIIHFKLGTVKGHLISERLFDVFNFHQKTNENNLT